MAQFQPRLEEVVAALQGNGHDVRAFGWDLPAVPKELTRAFYNSCDACLVPLAPLPIFAGALPTKLFEIMACGRPVVASAAGLVPDALRDSGAGWAVPPGDAAGTTHARGFG